MEARNDKNPGKTRQALEYGIAKNSPTSESAFKVSPPQSNAFFFVSRGNLVSSSFHDGTLASHHIRLAEKEPGWELDSENHCLQILRPIGRHSSLPLPAVPAHSSG